ncbi:MAG: response regulator [Porticoccaceae bacterium]|nr:response regulator [Pseudomonadales bacterium]MCP5171417.1 response regulator [Pseudomonadales bacterium]
MGSNVISILYVEDDRDIREVTEMVLADERFELVACSSGQEAVSAAADLTPDLLLLDVMMPGLDGPATLKSLRMYPQLKNTPVIFMTAKVQASEVAQYEALGAIGVIRKPFDPMTLAEQIVRLFTTAKV